MTPAVTRAAWPGVFAAFVLLWLLLDRSAALLGSTRGEAGLLVCGLTVAGVVVCETVLSRRPIGHILVDIGFRAPALGAMTGAAVLTAVMLLFFPAFAALTGVRLQIHPDAALLAVGILAQGGIAEEVVFRGFLFRRLRTGRSFWGAASLATIPFGLVHSVLFFTLDWPIALASMLLALSISFPLAWLFERSGGSILPSAIVHAVVQGAIKLVDASAHFPEMAVAWIALSAVAPWALFLLRPKRPNAMDSKMEEKHEDD